MSFTQCVLIASGGGLSMSSTPAKRVRHQINFDASRATVKTLDQLCVITGKSKKSLIEEALILYHRVECSRLRSIGGV